MELLTIQHQDFLLNIECTKFNEIWGKAKRNIGEEKLFSTYSWSDGVESVFRRSPEGDLPLAKGDKAPAIFFDNADYPVWVEFNDYVKDAQFGSILQSENDKFSFRKHILAGFLNYGNEIGRSELHLVYAIGGEKRKFTFSYEVLSTKLDYHEHWKSIIEDIEQEYRMLSLDYMRRTFHGFSSDPNADIPEIIWWSVFAEEQKKFIKACKSIIERPRRRLQRNSVYKRADQLTYVPTTIENELAEHRREEAHLYKIDEKVQTNDTQENRFLKFALSQITKKYGGLKSRIDKLNNLSQSAIDDIQETFNTLKHLERSPFFRTIGRFKGMNQESLILQKATGYSQVYRTWNLLRRGYSLDDGMYRLQTKDIATLYEIWCFIEVSHIVKEQLHLTDEDIDHRNRMELNGLFTWELGKGEHSRILFSKDGVELAELIYNPKNSDKEDESISIKNLVAPTVPQKPDIVLQLTKDDLRNGMKMTYLFDAKYRIDGRSKGVDTPPDDAINQMHRYRDAIYYNDYSQDVLKKEVIGGYILFPGDGEPADVAEAKFYESIEKVNIGAFPLRPKDKRNRAFLEKFISDKIALKGTETVEAVIPQKGTFVDVGKRVVLSFVREDNPQWEEFCKGIATQYYSGDTIENNFAFDDLHYLIPYLKGKGLRDVYEINKIYTGLDSRNVNLNDLRLYFDIKYSHPYREDYVKVKQPSMFINKPIHNMTFDELRTLLAESSGIEEMEV